jgi:hypothetical protein
LNVIARSEATKQSSAREARQTKMRGISGDSVHLLGAPAGARWIASLRSQ